MNFDDWWNSNQSPRAHAPSDTARDFVEGFCRAAFNAGKETAREKREKKGPAFSLDDPPL